MPDSDVRLHVMLCRVLGLRYTKFVIEKAVTGKHCLKIAILAR